MNDLVFLEPNCVKAIPFTTSDVIAQSANIANRSVYLLIEKHINQLERFGRVSFEMRPSQTKGGVQEVKIYRLNEEQATLLITFLKNTEPVIEFKVNLVKAFFAMKQELFNRKAYRQELKPIRRELTDVIQENPEHSKWAFKQYTDLAYKIVTGKIASTLRKDRGAEPNATAIDYMAAEEIASIAKVQSKIATLYELGMDYQQIKALLSERLMVGRVS